LPDKGTFLPRENGKGGYIAFRCLIPVGDAVKKGLCWVGGVVVEFELDIKSFSVVFGVG